MKKSYFNSRTFMMFNFTFSGHSSNLYRNITFQTDRRMVIVMLPFSMMGTIHFW